MIKPQILKGFRDFLPGEARKRQYVINTLKQVFESFGFEPLETPALEYEEILTGKYGDEGDKLMYRFEDNGKRRVALRYDQTVPLARVVAQYQNELPMPFKRYQIQPVWRAENTQKGRYREFVQCDIDTVGTNALLADAEIIACVLKAIEKLGFSNIVMFINDRKNFEGIDAKYISTIDKLDKIGRNGVLKELEGKGLDASSAESLLVTIEKKDVTNNVKKILSYFKSLAIQSLAVTYKQTLARGLDYYTGSIFEIATTDAGGLSLGGGGRYDDLIGTFAGRQIPAVGFAFGFDRLMEAMEQLQLFPTELQTTDVIVTVFSPELLEKSLHISTQLRTNHINTELYLDENAKMEKQLKYANQKGIPYVVIIGPEEAEKDVVVLKDMQARTQETVTVEELINKIKVRV